MKLLEFKEWVTLADGAAHLSAFLDVPVTEADVLQFAVEGRLTLSVNIVNPVTLRRGKVVPRESAPRVPGIPIKGKEPYDVVLGVKLNDDEVLVLEEGIVQASSGLLDIPMFGGDRLDVEGRLQSMIAGPPVTSTNLDGVFLIGRDETWYQLLEHFSENEFFDKKKLEKKYFHPSNFYPAGDLREDDLQIVLRPDSIFRFLSDMSPRREAVPERRRGDEHSPGPLSLFNHWLKCDSWEEAEGLLLISGIDPEVTEFIDPHPFGDYPGYSFAKLAFLDYSQLVQPDRRNEKNWTKEEIRDDDTLMGHNLSWQRLWRLWRSGDHPSRAKPEYFVQWGQAKGVSIDWLPLAQAKGFFQGNQKSVERSEASENVRPLATRERNTLLALIGVLCEMAGVDFKKPAKAAVQIQSKAELMGVSLGETTVENHLKRVPEALSIRGR